CGRALGAANPLTLLHDALLCLSALVQIRTHVLQTRGGFSEKSGRGKRLFRSPDARQDQQHQRVISMPTFVDMMKCDGCGECVEICPSDIMHIDPIYRRSYNIEPNFCWGGFSCVKACPQHAMHVRGCAGFAPLGTTARGLR